LTLFRGELVVAFDEAGADEEDVADFDVATVGFRGEVEVLGGGACAEGGEGYRVLGVGVVGDVVCYGVVAVVEENCAAGDTVGCPVVDAAAGRGLGAFFYIS
jgi:hypothetical protein